MQREETGHIIVCVSRGGVGGSGFSFLATKNRGETSQASSHDVPQRANAQGPPSRGRLWAQQYAGWHGGEGYHKTVWGTLSSFTVQEDPSHFLLPLELLSE